MATTDIRKLQAAIERRVQQCLRERIEPMIKNIIQETTQKNVYDVYDPLSYERRGKNGGMLDRKNYIAEYDGMALYVYNRTPADGSDFDPLVYNIEYGYDMQDKPYNVPRPSMYPAQRELMARRDEVEGFLREYLQ